MTDVQEAFDFDDDPGTPEAVLSAEDARDLDDPSDAGCGKAVWE